MGTNVKISACGLYCGTCRKFVRGSCPGCAANDRASWCKVRSCCREHGWTSCAECTAEGIDTCRKFNNFIAACFAFVFRSDRHGCIRRIREVGCERFAAEMEAHGCYNRPVTSDR